jgi:hypothetical protein
MTTVDISCVEVWRELSNDIDEAVEPALRQRMEEPFNACKHCAAVLGGTRNVIACPATAVCLICLLDLASA